MAFDRAAAKAAGYSDEEIDAYLQANPEVAKATPPAPASADTPPPPSTVVPEIDRTNEALATVGLGAGNAISSVTGLAKDLVAPAATAYGAYKLGQVANAAVNRMGQGPVAPVGSPTNPIGGQSAPSSPTAKTIPVTGPAAPETVQVNRAPAPTGAPAADMYGRVEPTMGAQAAEGARPAGQIAQAAEKPSMLKNFAQMAGKYGSALAESPLGKTLGGVARIAGSAPVMGAQMALYSGGLNAGEDQQLARIRAIQDTIGKLPKEQQSFYFTLPMNKKQQIDQMIMNGQDPSALLVPNAVNSGYAQQLKTLGR